MDSLFMSRMGHLLDRGSVGAKLVRDSNSVESKLFTADPNYKDGMIYDWDMNEIEPVSFKFEKERTYTAGEYEIEYLIHFMAGFNPESKYSGRYYVSDGKERLGFYLDVWDESKELYDKYLIVGKDQRVAFDRYNAFRCNWYLEWVVDGKYYRTLCHVKNTANAHSKYPTANTLGGTTVNGDMSVLLPTNRITKTIRLGQRFMICDDYDRPQVYETIKINDNTPLGVYKVYLKQALHNEHTDFGGIINESDSDFIFDLPIEDLPERYGGKYHMICDCIKRRTLHHTEKTGVWHIDCPNRYLYFNASPTVMKAVPSDMEIAMDFEWHVYIDGVEYPMAELADYFDVSAEDDTFSIACINRDMDGYIVKVEIKDAGKTYCDFVEMEVKR